MFYYNAKYAFALPGQAPAAIAGGIIAASAMPAGQLVRRDFRKYPYLQHRLFDPQMYLSSLDPNVARKSVVNLASGPGSVPVPFQNTIPTHIPRLRIGRICTRTHFYKGGTTASRMIRRASEMPPKLRSKPSCSWVAKSSSFQVL